MKEKAQIAMETIMGIAAVLMVLLLVVVVNLNRDSLVSELDSFYGEANECNEVAMIVSLVFSEGPFSKAEFSVAADVNVLEGAVVVGNTYCDFVGLAVPANVSGGDIVAKNISGVVVVENV